MEIPLIDCDTTARSDVKIAEELDAALRDVGFMAVHNLGLPIEVVLEAFTAAQTFFAETGETKSHSAYLSAEENFGYQGMLEETLDPTKPADLKETFTMRNLMNVDIPSSRWPSGAFQRVAINYYQHAMQAADRLMRLLAMALEVPEDFFVQHHNGENVTLRFLHYPPVATGFVEQEQMGAGAHTDYGMLTLLVQGAVGGLQVLGDSDDGSKVWIDVPPRPDAIVINSGDLLERWSNGRYRSTVHRVLPQSGASDRYSIALFVDPDSATQVSAIESCLESGAAPLYPPTTAGEHLQEKILATHI